MSCWHGKTIIGPGSDKKQSKLNLLLKKVLTYIFWEWAKPNILSISTGYRLSVTTFVQRKQLKTDLLLINFMERVEMMTMTRTISSSFLQQRLPPSLRCTVPRQFGWKYTRVAPLFICRLSHLRSFLFSTLYSPFLTVVFEYFPTDSYCTLVQRLRIYGLPCHYTIL